MAVDYYLNQSDEPVWPRSVAREARFMWAANEVKARETLHIELLERAIALNTMVTIGLTTAEIYAELGKITDPRVRRVMEIVAQRIVDLHAKHQEGTYRIAWEQFAVQLSRIMTPHSPKPDAFWENLVSAVFGV